MPSIWKRFARPEAEDYAFPEAAELRVEEPEPPCEPPGEEPGEPPSPAIDPRTPVDFARLEAELILRDARERAAELLSEARRASEEEAEELRGRARDEGRRDGYAEGMARAMTEAREQREAKAVELEAEVQRFLEGASRALDEQMDRSVEELRDLALAVAEKVVRVSLKSSGEVIGRMIQSAVEKRKRREWAHIYIADCDARRMTQAPPALTAALGALSSRVRIIPMADDESGTLIVEMPDEIVDASAATQLSNIRDLLADAPPEDRGPGPGPLR